MEQPSKNVALHYDAVVENYHEQYDSEKLFDISRPYPANYFRLQLLINSFTKYDLKKIIEVGVGEGTPLSTLGKAGFDIWGFDISREMVKKSKEKMKSNGMNPEHIFWGDIQDPTTYIHSIKDGKFDGLLAMGVMPHVENDEFILENMRTLIRPGGRVFIEFRNKLFSLFTFNRYTLEFIAEDLLRDVNVNLKNIVIKDLEKKLRMDVPPVREKVEGTDTPGYDRILSRFHNPLEISKFFERNGFTDIKLAWYHYHPMMPYLEEKAPDLFRQESINLEHETSIWRGLFFCSAFVVEAKKKGE